MLWVATVELLSLIIKLSKQVHMLQIIGTRFSLLEKGVRNVEQQESQHVVLTEILGINMNSWLYTHKYTQT